jgi:general secretion pathway protein G
MKIKYNFRHLGFTLIEMLVVISIIGILATLVAANLNSARSRARDAERKSDLKNIETALRIYYNDKGSYPANDSGSQMKACDPGGTASCSWGSQWSVDSTVYMQTLPKDPLSPAQEYRYTMGSAASPSDTDAYILQACLENKSDSNGVAAGGWCPSGVMFQIQP